MKWKTKAFLSLPNSNARTLPNLITRLYRQIENFEKGMNLTTNFIYIYIFFLHELFFWSFQVFHPSQSTFYSSTPQLYQSLKCYFWYLMPAVVNQISNVRENQQNIPRFLLNLNFCTEMRLKNFILFCRRRRWKKENVGNFCCFVSREK